MSASVGLFLVHRCRIYSSSSLRPSINSFLGWRLSVATQTQTQTLTLIPPTRWLSSAAIQNQNQNQNQIQKQTSPVFNLHYYQMEKQKKQLIEQKTVIRVPWLMLSSPSNPQVRYFYVVTTNNNDDIEFKCEMNLPYIAGQTCIGSSDGFLITIQEKTKHINVINPLTGAQLSSFFPSSSLLPFPPPLSVPTNNSGNQIYLNLLHGKAVLSPSLRTLVVIFCGIAVFAHAGDVTWTSYFPYDCEDCVFHKGLLYGIDYNGGLTIYNLDDPTAKPKFYTTTQMDFMQEDEMTKSLVVSPDGEDLFLVFRGAGDYEMSTRWPYRTRVFEIFKLDQNSFRWNKVESLGDVAFFVGHNRSMSLPVRSSSLKPNSIYFTDNWAEMYLFQPENVGDTGVYDLGDRSFHFFNLKYGDQELNYPPPVWFVPSI